MEKQSPMKKKGRSETREHLLSSSSRLFKEEETHTSKKEKDGDTITSIPTPCSSCHQWSNTNICVTNIPHFKEIVIMAFNCEHCGYRSNEVKPGGGPIPEYGIRIQLTVQDKVDLTRDIIKSSCAGIEIPELELELSEGSLGGFYTTVEGLLEKIYNQLKEANPFGESDGVEENNLYSTFLDNLKDMKEGKVFPFTLIINDPISNSFVGSVRDVHADDKGSNSTNLSQPLLSVIEPHLEIQRFIRSHEQNEMLGLNHKNPIM